MGATTLAVASLLFSVFDPWSTTQDHFFPELFLPLCVPSANPTNVAIRSPLP
jgi:hypothetical protein